MDVQFNTPPENHQALRDYLLERQLTRNITPRRALGGLDGALWLLQMTNHPSVGWVEEVNAFPIKMQVIRANTNVLSFLHGFRGIGISEGIPDSYSLGIEAGMSSAAYLHSSKEGEYLTPSRNAPNA